MTVTVMVIIREPTSQGLKIKWVNTYEALRTVSGMWQEFTLFISHTLWNGQSTVLVRKGVWDCMLPLHGLRLCTRGHELQRILSNCVLLLTFVHTEPWHLDPGSFGLPVQPYWWLKAIRQSSVPDIRHELLESCATSVGTRNCRLPTLVGTRAGIKHVPGSAKSPWVVWTANKLMWKAGY